MSEVLFNTHDAVLLCTMLMCIIFALLLLQLPQPSKLHKVFIIGFCLASFAIPLDILINFGAGFHPWMVKHHLTLIYLFEFGAWLQAPMAYFLVRSQLDKNFQFKAIDYLLLLPLFLNTSHQLIAYHSLPLAIKESIQSTMDIMDLSITIFFVQTAREIFRLALALASITLLKKYTLTPESNLKPNQLTWLHVLAYGLCLYTSISLLNAIFLTAQVLTKYSLPVGYIGLFQNYICAVYFISLVSKLHSDAVQQCFLKPLQLSKGTTKSGFNFAHIQTLEPLMLNNKIYTNPELSLDDLAHSVGVSPRTLSGVINGHYGCSFFEFINGYRIQEAKRLLSESAHKSTSVLDIMYEAGFNSKATFNGMFKKTEGMTPSQYRKTMCMHQMAGFEARP
ncbi:helix-turn-helix domain-containing protein [Simiduia curdlanivorans]|uniref:Helix-turn-helix domain-containing protein n=1 Tax=Simiduia curdlanivorans TaxID=1492769 RepID=A0ABV8V388_9GAMM|nr:helix-turn-helix domain-containing protein [Simiduia curdlanivorans]MDN3638321.1 helix-turn-helix domain-containing protein [Simiduia curdlanivorans]